LGDGGMKRMEKTFIRIHQDFETYQMAFKMAVANQERNTIDIKDEVVGPLSPYLPIPSSLYFFIRTGARR